MKESFEKQEKTNLENIKEAIANSPQKIQDEFERSENDWFACYRSRLSVIRMYLHFIKEEGSLPEDECEALEKRLEDLKAKVIEFEKSHSREKEPQPTEEIRQELLDGLDIFQ